MKKLELTGDQIYPCFKKAKPKAWSFFHFDIPDGVFHEADIVLLREKPGDRPIVLKNRYGTPVE